MTSILIKIIKENLKKKLPQLILYHALIPKNHLKQQKDKVQTKRPPKLEKLHPNPAKKYQIKCLQVYLPENAKKSEEKTPTNKQTRCPFTHHKQGRRAKRNKWAFRVWKNAQNLLSKLFRRAKSILERFLGGCFNVGLSLGISQAFGGSQANEPKTTKKANFELILFAKVKIWSYIYFPLSFGNESPRPETHKSKTHRVAGFGSNEGGFVFFWPAPNPGCHFPNMATWWDWMEKSSFLLFSLFLRFVGTRVEPALFLIC